MMGDEERDETDRRGDAEPELAAGEDGAGFKMESGSGEGVLGVEGPDSRRDFAESR